MTADDLTKVIAATTALVGVVVAGLGLVLNYKSQANTMRFEFVKRQHASAEVLLAKMHDIVTSLRDLQSAVVLNWKDGSRPDLIKNQSLRTDFNKNWTSFELLIVIHGVYFPKQAVADFVKYAADSFVASISCFATHDSLAKATDSMAELKKAYTKSYLVAVNAIRSCLGTEAISTDLAKMYDLDIMSAVGLTPARRENAAEFVQNSARFAAEAVKNITTKVTPP